MKPLVLGMAQPYPGYSCEQVTIVASRILDTIVAFGQTRHNINRKEGKFSAPENEPRYILNMLLGKRGERKAALLRIMWLNFKDTNSAKC
jgi:hypothetical protein